MNESIRILVVDDQERARQGLKSLLATWPRIEIVSEAANGREAVQLVEESQPNLVLMDGKMVIMDGVEDTRLIKERWSDIRVVVLTMHASYRADALGAGADAFLIKGCTAEELLEAILGRWEVERCTSIHTKPRG
jgi:DNA-binding NarL/FixJ family response regulator